MKTYSELLRTDLENLRNILKQRKKYPSNSSYKERERSVKLELDKDTKSLLKFLNTNYSRQFLEEKSKLTDTLNNLLSSGDIDERFGKIDETFSLLNSLDVEVGPLITESSFEIPEIPNIEVKLDVEEAKMNLNNNSFVSSLVMSRRAYEGALLELFKKIEGRDPIELKCEKCGRGGYMGIIKLHNWALEKRFVNEKLKSLGYLISDLGAGGAHPPLQDFPRDKGIARASLAALLAVLDFIYKKSE
ncbi:MAG: hypothetical protein HYW24_02295 [Candidatus Aenigmarchaeota archaeon]|nr:hypothetical protein [Candidatus Aenigmarchaeota archaeon]